MLEIVERSSGYCLFLSERKEMPSTLKEVTECSLDSLDSLEEESPPLLSEREGGHHHPSLMKRVAG